MVGRMAACWVAARPLPAGPRADAWGRLQWVDDHRRRSMNEPDLFDALREQGIDANDAEVRAAIRATRSHVSGVRDRLGGHRARRCMEAMHAALAYELRHPDVGDMSSFEESYDDET